MEGFVHDESLDSHSFKRTRGSCHTDMFNPAFVRTLCSPSSGSWHKARALDDAKSESKELKPLSVNNQYSNYQTTHTSIVPFTLQNLIVPSHHSSSHLFDSPNTHTLVPTSGRTPFSQDYTHIPPPTPIRPSRKINHSTNSLPPRRAVKCSAVWLRLRRGDLRVQRRSRGMLHGLLPIGKRLVAIRKLCEFLPGHTMLRRKKNYPGKRPQTVCV